METMVRLLVGIVVVFIVGVIVAIGFLVANDDKPPRKPKWPGI